MGDGSTTAEQLYCEHPLSKAFTPIREIVRDGLLLAESEVSSSLTESKLNSTRIRFQSLGAAMMVTAALMNSDYASAAPCSTLDVSLTIDGAVYLPSVCADGIAQGGGPAAETSALDLALVAAGAPATGFLYLDKSDDPATPVGIGGISFVVGADANNSGSWTVSWTEQLGAPNLPLTIDFAVGLFGGNNGSGYFFGDVLLPSNPNAGSGTYDINFLNSSGNTEPNLGHLLLAGGNVSSEARISPNAVPEPATLALLGVGLAGLAAVRRPRRKV